MSKFIRSIDRKFLINVSKIHRIYQVVNPVFLDIPVRLFNSGQETGIHCDISGEGNKSLAIPLATLSGIKRSVKVHHSRIRSEQFIKALSFSYKVSLLIDWMMDQVEHSLANNENVIDMSVVLDLVIARHWQIFTLEDRDCYDAGDPAQDDSE